MVDAEPVIVLATIAILMGAAIVGIVFPFAWAARSRRRFVPDDAAEPRFDAQGLPWMPTGDIFESEAPPPWSTEATSKSPMWPHHERND